jgi:hypothetical protein
MGMATNKNKKSNKMAPRGKVVGSSGYSNIKG